jgi:Stage II sporulation protein E (SpoIIE)
VAPSHILRHPARFLAARIGLAIAVFLAIAIALLIGGSNGLLGSAEANNGDHPSDPPATVEEPVLGGDTDPVGEGPPVDETTVPDDEPTTPEEPSTPPVDEEEPPVDEPPVDEGDPGVDDPGAGERTPGDPETEEPPTSGGDKGDPVDPEEPPEDPSEDPAPPSGGDKDESPPEEPEVEEPAPDPNSLPQVNTPEGEEPGPAPVPQDEPDGPVAQINPEGDGELADPMGNESDEPTSVRFGGAAQNDGGGVVANGGGGGDAGVLAGGTELAAVQAGGEEPAGDGGTGPTGNDENQGGSGDDESNVVTNTVERLVEVVPDELKAALAALAALSVMLGIGYLLAALRARRLARQRRELLQEVGLLQTALLPPVPDKVGALLTSVAYRPADGPGAGGDFYDVLPLTGGRVGFILGDVSGHGRGALARTAFMRYTLRAYLEAGLEPRVALQVAGRVIDDNLGGDFATVLLAVHDPETGSLTYASAGHPAPIVVGPNRHDPITAASSPPIGVGVRTGLRQTTVPLVPGAVAALFTDGLLEARTEDGILGRERLTELLEGIGDDATARRLIEQVAAEANVRSDDMAAVVVSPTAGVTTGSFRTEQLELSTRELEGPIARRFLEACGLPEQEIDDAERDARLLSERFGGVVLHVVFGNRLRVEVLPRNVESIEAASRRVSAGSQQ